MGEPQNTTEYLIVTLPWIIVILGVLGNAFCIVVMLRKQFRNKNIGVYLLALAILDTVYLLSNTLFHNGIEIIFGVDVQALSNPGCAIVKYVIVASSAMSAWILVVLSVERMLSLAIPHLALSINTKKRAVITALVVVIAQGTIYTYNFVTTEVYQKRCTWTAEAWNNRGIINVFDFMNYSLIPSVVMATSNSVLIYLLKHSQELRSSQGGTDLRSVTILVVITSMAFIILSMPVMIRQIVVVVGGNAGPPQLYPALYVLDLLNHAVNFLLYCVSGASFRKEVKAMFAACCSKSNNKPTSSRTNTTPINPTSLSNPDNVGSPRMGSDSGDVEDLDMKMM